MMDVLKRIFIGIIVGMSIFFLKTTVFALETASVQVYSSNQSGFIPLYNSNNDVRKYVNLTFNNNFTNTVGYDYIQFSISATLQFIDQNYDSDSITHGIPMIIGAYIVGNDTTAYCQATYSSIQCPIKKGSTYSRLTLFVSTINNNGVTAGAVRYFVDQRVMVYSSEIKQGVQESIQDQTDDIADMDEQPSATYNNDYSTNSYDQAEQSMNQNINVDVSSFTFNPLSWTRSFGWIWDTVDEFVNINAKVFLTITTFLTFSFVGLVIGRS